MDNLKDTSYTPRRAQKCLFSCDSDSFKTISRNLNYNRNIAVSSEDESDLGPMSPLALTDRSPSSCGSSSGREYISPLITPKKSTQNISPLSWDRLTSRLSRCSADDNLSPFSSLKKLTRAARYSPRGNIFSKFSEIYPPPSSPNQSSEPSTPEDLDFNAIMDEIVPETPHRSFATELQNEDITETPRKNRSPEYRLITPLASITKTSCLPQLVKRKSFSTFETRKNFSSDQKENILKRRNYSPLTIKPAKLFKENDISVPKARAALFQEKKDESKNLKNFSLSTKTFYSTCDKTERVFAFGKVNDITVRRSLPASHKYRHSLKKQKSGRINAGVFHGIKKRKQKINSEILKKEAYVTKNAIDKSSCKKQTDNTKETIVSAQEPTSPKIDESKRFFKTNKTIKLNQTATVTVHNNIKLKVRDGKILLNQKRIPFPKHARMQGKTAKIAVDAIDLIMDEPEVEVTLEKDKVANILKILEDDWANDDYDRMEVLKNTVSSPKLLRSTEDMIMSPTSELSNMTSTMNIKDMDQHVASTNSGNIPFNNMENNDNNEKIGKDSGKEYFPLFAKGYSAADNIFEEINVVKSTKSTKKSMQWQLSAKGGGGEDQYQLDVGQKRFGATQCPECNVVYELGNPEDENAHLNYHNSIRTLKFQGWKTERVMMEDTFTSSRIILVDSHDPKPYWKKVSDILAVVDRELGLADMKISNYENKKIFLYIREKSVLGVLVAEHITTAYRMIPELIELNCCTAEGTPTKCGINVVWTAMSHRRQGIATKLVDTLRAKFFYGYVMSLDDIAFSNPTPSGKIFAEKYTKTKNFKVYH